MRWSDLLRMSVSSLRRRKLRTFLTVLGVVIGTASIVVMISLGLGLQESMYKEVEQNGGTTSITVTGKDSGGMMYGYSGMSSDEEESQKYITDDVIKELKNVAHVKSAEPILSISIIALKGKYEGFIELTGMTAEGLKATSVLRGEGIRVNMTLVFSANQALLAARSGAAFVSPFIGRLNDIGASGAALIKDIVHIFSLHDIRTQIIAASIRTPMDVLDCALAGAHIATVPYKILEQMIQHPLTAQGIEKFRADSEAVRV